MATNGPTTEAEIDLVANGAPVVAAIDEISKKIVKIQEAIEKITSTSGRAAKDFDQQLTQSTAALLQAVGQLKGLENTLNGPRTNVVQNLNRNKAMADQTVKATQYAAVLKNANTSAEALEARLNAVNKKIAEIGKTSLAKDAQLAQRLGLEQAQKQLKELDAQLNKLDEKARRTNGDFSGQRAGVSSTRDQLQSALMNPRRSNFTPEMQAVSQAQLALENSITAARQKQAQILTSNRQVMAQAERDEVAARDKISTQIEKDYAARESAQKAELTRQQQIDAAYTSAAKQRTQQEQLAYQQRDEQEKNARKRQSDDERQGEAIVSARTRLQMRADADADNARQKQVRSDATRLETMKQMARQEVADATQTGQLQALRERTENRIVEARSRLKTATMEEEVALQKILKTEQDRLNVIKQQENATLRQQRSNPFSAASWKSAAANTLEYGVAGGAMFAGFSAAQQAATFVLQFDDALAKLQAISGSTTGQMLEMRQTILDVGKTSRYSLTDIADAATILAQAGYSVKEMGQTLGATANLASASGSTMAESVDLMTASLGSFQLSAAESVRISDILVAALNRSKLNVNQVALAIQYAGATAREQNISLEQLVATAGALANAGIRNGSTIGTGMREFLVELQTPTRKLEDEFKRLKISMADVDVTTRGLPAVLETLKNSGFGAAQAYAGLEKRAAAAYIVMKDNVPAMNELALAETQQGVAVEAAGRAMGSLSAQWQALKNVAATDLSNSFKPLLEDLKNTLKVIVELSNEFDKFKIAAQDAENWVHKFSDPAGKNKSYALFDAETLTGLASGAYQHGYEGIGSALEFLANGAKNAEEQTADLATKLGDATDAANSQKTVVNEVESSLERLVLQQDSLKNNSTALGAETGSLTARFQGLSSILLQNTNDVNGLIASMRQLQLQEAATLRDRLVMQRSRTQQTANQNKLDTISTYNNSANSMPADIRQLMQTVINDPRRRAQAIGKILDRTKVPGNLSVSQVQTLNTFASSAASFQANSTAATQLGNQSAQADIMAGPIGARVNRYAQDSAAEVQKATSGAAGKTPEERAKATAAALSDLDRKVATLDRGIAAARDPNGLQVLQQAKADLLSKRQALASVAEPTDKETKAAERAQRKADAEARRKAREAERAQHHFEQNDTAVAQEGLKAANLDLNQTLKDNKDPSTRAEFDEGKKDLQQSLNDWIDARNELLKAQLAEKHMTPEQIANMKEEVRQEIDTKRESIASDITKNFLKYISNSLDEIDKAATERARPGQTKLGIAQAVRSGLDRPENAGIPDFVKVLQDRRVNQAQLAADQSQIPINEQKIAELNAKASETEAQAKTLVDNLGKATDQSEELKKKAEEIRVQVRDLTADTEKLRASLAAAALAPHNLKEALGQAIDAYRETAGLNLSFTQQLEGGLTQAITGVHAAFTSFFETMIEKPQDVLTAFGTMAQGVMKAIDQMAAEAIAKQIFGLLLNLVPGGGLKGFGSTVASNEAVLNGLSSGFSFGHYHGGMVGYNGGGLVVNGNPLADSVNARLAKGEYVVRKNAVDSLGPDFLHRLNQQGSRALVGLAATPTIMPAPSHQEMKVYVVAPEEKPSMGPNDVLLTVHRDILNGGSTKKLIKHVAQGG